MMKDLTFRDVTFLPINFEYSMAGNWSDLYEQRHLIGILRFYERAWNPRARPRNYLLTYARLNRIGSNRILRDPNEV